MSSGTMGWWADVTAGMRQRDIRGTPLYAKAEALCEAIRRPGTGQISDAAEVDVSADARRAVFSGTFLECLEGVPPTRICSIDLVTSDVRILTFGPNTDRAPRFSPDGRRIAFLSDRREAGDFQLYLLDLQSGAVHRAPGVEGWVEYLHWSPDGTRVLLGVAGHGADLSGAQGAVTSRQLARGLPAWIPSVETGDEAYRWRRVWVYDLAADRVCQVGSMESNVWEAVWCGNDALAAVVSPGPGEGLWYSARLCVTRMDSEGASEVYRPRDQLGWLAASPSGEHLAIVEAFCSDRGLVAGDLRLIETRSGRVSKIDTAGADITHTEWCSEQRVLLAGHRGLETIVGIYDVMTGTFTETWTSRDITTGGRFITISRLNDRGDFALVGESFLKAPEVSVVRQGEYRTLKSFDLGYAAHAQAIIDAVEPISWQAPDGVTIQGWLLLPKGHQPHPLVMHIHGGPVWHARPTWLGRVGLPTLLLLKEGYAVFYPNARGSAGRGQEFARRIQGDMGGADTHDFLSGIDHLVEQGMIDAKRLGVTGGSYGGFMTSWLITQDSRFAAAVAVAPFNNPVTEHLLSNIPTWLPLFFSDHYTNLSGKYFTRSAVMQAHKARTPTLNICGALDRSAPPEEAAQFHSALRENGVSSMLVTYPLEGHGIRKFPAAIDYAARVVAWFEEHMLPMEDEGKSGCKE